jgi:hypothetical protein
MGITETKLLSLSVRYSTIKETRLNISFLKRGFGEALKARKFRHRGNIQITG